MNKHAWIIALTSALALTACATQDSLPSLKDGKAPTNLSELWGDYDPCKEPLDTQVVREWKEGDNTYRTVIFTIGTFKGKVARLAAFYAFPKSDKKLPAILQIHGGGQNASVESVKHSVENGYVGLSINWGGNDLERMEKGDPNTDWGALDATQKHNDHYSGGKPDPKTLDDVESPRNNNWFLLVLAARRGLTFLEQQPEVDPKRLGVTGHSMGGKITVDVAGIDKRVKAAVPSCGGSGGASGKLSGMPGSGVTSDKPSVFDVTIDDRAYIPGVTCPILFMSPSNDFAGPFDNMTENWKKIGSKTVAYTVAPHLNHRGLAETGICGILWFDQHLKGIFSFPKTPELAVTLNTANNIPCATLIPDRPDEVIKVDLYYSVDPHCLTRFWRDAEAKKRGDTWIAACSLLSADQPLYVYANVSYALKTERVEHRGGKAPSAFMISSKEAVIYPEELKSARVKATDKPSRMIDDFSRGWQDWFRLEWGNPHVWVATTRKLKDPKWRGPAGAKLVFEVKCPKDNVICVVADLNGWGSFPGKPGGSYEFRKPLTGSPEWQTVSIGLDDMVSTKKDSPGKLTTWETVTELSIRRAKSYLQDGQEIDFGVDRTGWSAPREFRNLRWEGGVYGAETIAPVALTDAAPKDLNETIQKEIKKSIELEKADQKAAPAATTPAQDGTAIPSPWQTQDIGNSPVTRKASFKDGAFVISGSGKERISRTADSFHFVYQKWSGDGTITVKLTDIQDKAVVHFDTYGVMFRESLEKDSTMFTMAHCSYSSNVLIRKETSGYAPDYVKDGTNQKPPLWLRIARKGSTFTGSYSLDGATWTVQQSETLNLPQELYVGMCVSSESDEVASTATFENVTVTRDEAK
jgi:regulation of enolase protein 1 (concanavalin A-like superfamily)